MQSKDRGQIKSGIGASPSLSGADNATSLRLADDFSLSAEGREKKIKAEKEQLKKVLRQLAIQRDDHFILHTSERILEDTLRALRELTDEYAKPFIVKVHPEFGIEEFTPKPFEIKVLPVMSNAQISVAVDRLHLYENETFLGFLQSTQGRAYAEREKKDHGAYVKFLTDRVNRKKMVLGL